MEHNSDSSGHGYIGWGPDNDIFTEEMAREWRKRTAELRARAAEILAAREQGCPCAGVGWLGKEWLYKREPRCSCGAGDPDDWETFHGVECDSVPCPFCALED